jgi:hypothetical protein
MTKPDEERLEVPVRRRVLPREAGYVSRREFIELSGMCEASFWKVERHENDRPQLPTRAPPDCWGVCFRPGARYGNFLNGTLSPSPMIQAPISEAKWSYFNTTKKTAIASCKHPPFLMDFLLQVRRSFPETRLPQPDAL